MAARKICLSSSSILATLDISMKAESTSSSSKILILSSNEFRTSQGRGIPQIYSLTQKGCSSSSWIARVITILFFIPLLSETSSETGSLGAFVHASFDAHGHCWIEERPRLVSHLMEEATVLFFKKDGSFFLRR